MLETSVCIELVRGRSAASAIPAPGECVISSITVAELETGIGKSAAPGEQRAAVEAFLNLFPVVAFDRTAARHYGEIRAFLEKRGISIGPLDLLIAAHARSISGTIVTVNAREFQRVPGLKCLAWKRGVAS